MTAYLLVTLTIRDPSWIADYSAAVPALVARHGGVYLVTADTIERFEGDDPAPDAIVLFTFPSLEAAKAFVADPDYQPWQARRLAGSTGDMLAFSQRA